MHFICKDTYSTVYEKILLYMICNILYMIIYVWSVFEDLVYLYCKFLTTSHNLEISFMVRILDYKEQIVVAKKFGFRVT